MTDAEQLAEIAEHVKQFGGDTVAERVANAMCDIHTCTACVRCGKGVRPRYAIHGMCDVCAGDVIEQMAIDIYTYCTTPTPHAMGILAFHVARYMADTRVADVPDPCERYRNALEQYASGSYWGQVPPSPGAPYNPDGYHTRWSHMDHPHGYALAREALRGEADK